MGDARRTRRLVKVADGMLSQGGGTIPCVFRSSAEAKAAYRLFDCEQVTHEAVCATHFERVRQQCAQPYWHLLIEDTTTLSYAGRDACEGLGPIGEGYTQGLWMHNTLAVRVQTDAAGQLQPRVLGLFDQQMWARPEEARDKKRQKETRRQRLARSRESQRWARILADHPAPPSATWVYVADRESDIYEVLERCESAGCHYVIRAAQDRALMEADVQVDQHLFDAAQQGQWMASMTITVRRQGKPTRQAQLKMCATGVTLRGPDRPGGRLPSRSVNVVLVQEVDPPANEEPLCWILLTDLPVQTAAQVRLVVDFYCCRWLIEEFHKALKTGLGIEKSQLSTARRLMALAGILSVVASFLLDLKLLAREDLGVQTILTEDDVKQDQEMFAVLEHKFGPPEPGWTAKKVMVCIAKLGGYLGRRNDGPPGWLTLWRGWQTLLMLVEGYKIARSRDG